MIEAISIGYGILMLACMLLGAYECWAGLPAVTRDTKGRDLATVAFLPGLVCILSCVPLIMLGTILSIPTVLAYVTCRNAFQPRKRDRQAEKQPQNTAMPDDDAEE